MNRKTILVVDDTKENVEILIELLSERYDVMVALDAKSGIDIVKEERPDLILLDIMMPEMDGYEMCEILKSDETTQTIPIIFITAKTDEKSIEKAYDIGAVDYVSKPFKSKELLARVVTQLTVVDLVENLENRVKFEFEKRVEQEKVLMHQSRLAAIGEMMDVIAHQWIQPISVINSQIALMGFDVKFKKIDEEYVENLQVKFTKQIKHMTTTLREFRNFFRPSHDSFYFDTLLMVQKTLTLVDDEFKSNGITIKIEHTDSFSLYGIENEFIHLLLNIINNINNAKDAFRDKRINDKEISIVLLQENDYNIIEISDNAGGIPLDIIDEIFKMNITSRAESSGTGIGLYISFLIAQKHKGTLHATNIKSGAKFILKQKVKILEQA